MSILNYEFVRNALWAGLLLSITSGIIGSLIVVKRDTFLIGGISHASFGGLGLFYFLGLNPILGAFTVSVLSGSVIGLTPERKLHTHNALIGVLWAFGMSIGIIFITLTPGFAPNLLTYLFGDILTVRSADILNILIYNIVLLITVFLFYKPLIVFLFDKEFAALHGIRVNLYRYFFYLFISVAIVLMIRSVGIILVLALFTIPPLIALPFAKRLPVIMLYSVIVCLVIFMGGFFIAYYTNLPTGPVIIMTGTLLMLIVRTLCHFTQKNS
ncbi:MAG: metal ABC transporter permease [Candidatus Marinimicrobia bacterium]|nr:metal ABC transporter permease [Candidatus Neomarinimicrobiota bacterium]